METDSIRERTVEQRFTDEDLDRINADASDLELLPEFLEDNYHVISWIDTETNWYTLYVIHASDMSKEETLRALKQAQHYLITTVDDTVA